MSYTSKQAMLTSRQVYEFISKQTGDPIIERRTCRVSGTKFPIFQSDKEFYEKISPKFETSREVGDELIAQNSEHFSWTDDGKLKVKIPFPTLCPEERQRRRILWRNESKLYRRNCDKTGKSIISIYSPDTSCVVYGHDIRRSDMRDALDYGQNIDFSKSFIEQFDNLLEKVPRIALSMTNSENSNYTHFAGYNKNCYLTFASEYNRDCLYSTRTMKSENCVDTLEISHCEHTYECVNVEHSHQVLFCQGCDNCHSSSFLFDCVGCHDCMMCTNLVNKSYCIFNKQYSKAEYEQKRQKLQNNSLVSLLNIFEQFKGEGIWRGNIVVNVEDVIGNYIFNAKKCHICFDVNDTENAKYVYCAFKTKNMMDVTNTTEQEWGYEGMSIGYKSTKCIFTNGGWTCSNIYYCYECHGCQNLFGCVGLRNKSYCIFNKQYTKQEWHDLAPQIIAKMIDEGVWGEFFDPSLSPFGYNETVAQEYFPLSREEAFARGYKRQDNEYPINVPEGMETIQAKDLPDSIDDVDDSLLQKAIICEVSGRPFRIVPLELQFYRTHGIALPRRHYDIRHEERLAKRPGRNLYLRTCDKCGEEMLSVYKHIEASESSEVPDKKITGKNQQKQKVYCEECYKQEVYG